MRKQGIVGASPGRNWKKSLALLALLSIATGVRAADAPAANLLTGQTNRPDNSTFAVGQPVELLFAASGLAELKEPVTLDLSIVDEHEQNIEAQKIPVKADATGRWQTTVQAPHAKLGFYRVYARLSNGTPVHGIGTRPAGFLTYIVVPDPAKRVDYGEDNTFFGMQGAYPGARDLLGVRWVLDDSIWWQRTEPDRAGQFGPEEIKKYISAPDAPTSGLPFFTLPPLYMMPAWAAVPGTLSYETGTLTPEGEKAWAAYCTKAAKAYAARNPTRKHHIYQITDEPIPPWGFKGTDAELLRIYEIAYPALHEADPAAIVAGPTRGFWGSGDPDETIRLLKLGLGKYIDAYIAHPYHSMTPEKDGMAQAIRRMKEALRSTTGKDIPMYGSSQGVATDEDVSKELQQARVATRQNLITFGEGFSFSLVFIYYDYRMDGSLSGYGYYYNLVDGVPFGPSTVCPKPVAAVYAAQSLLLEGSKSRGAIEGLGNSSCGYAFERADGVTLALWDFSGQAHDVTIPTGVKAVHIFDWMGNERVEQTNAGALTLKLGAEPVYVSGVSANLWGASGAKAVVPEAKRLSAFPGTHVPIKGKSLMHADKPFQGTLYLESEPAGTFKALSQKLSLGTDEAASFAFDLAVPAAIHPGEHTVNLRLCDADGSTIKATALTVVVDPPVAVTMNAAFTPEGKPALAVTLDEKQGRAAAGKVDVSLKEILPGADRGDAAMIDLVVDPGKVKAVPGAVKQIQFDLPAGGSKRLLVDFGDAPLAPAKCYQSLIVTSLDTGTRFSQTAPAYFLGAAHLDQPATIDGDLSEWQAMAPVALAGPEDVVRSKQYFPQGLTARLRYAWDAQNLYLSAEVDDDLFVQTHAGADIWSQDCLQLAFNLDAKSTGDTADTGERRTSEINVALTSKGPEAFRSVSYSAEKLPSVALTPAEFHLAVKKLDSGKLRYEMAIPWTTLGARAGESFKSGSAIGVGVTVNEVRSGNQQDPTALGLFGGIIDKNPDKQGILTLK